MKTLAHWIILNTVALSVSFYLYVVGVVSTAFENDALYINEAILVVFVIGMLGAIFKWRGTQWCADTLVGLGFFGTLFGVWSAFGSIKPENIVDVQSVVPILANLISGIGVAIWTTMIGLYFYTWLTANMVILDNEEE
jgi:hypothetical protein